MLAAAAPLVFVFVPSSFKSYVICGVIIVALIGVVVEVSVRYYSGIKFNNDNYKIFP